MSIHFSGTLQKKKSSLLGLVFSGLLLLGVETTSLSATPKQMPVPSAPFPVIAVVVSATQIKLNWLETPYGHKANTGYRIERSSVGNLSGNEGWTLVGTTRSSSYQDTSLQAGTHYYYRVFATGPGGISEDHSIADATTLSAPPTMPTRLTQAGVVQLAQDFCRKIGAPVTTVGQAEYPAPNEYPDEPDHHWQTRWKVTFPAQATIEVVDTSGDIVSYKNVAFDQYEFDQKDRPLEDTISETEALQRAEAVLRATGMGEELSAPKATYVEIAKPVKFGTRDWDVVWRRRFHGIPYAEGRVIVMLEAETGTVERLGTAFSSAPPSRASLLVNRDQAVHIAQATSISNGLAKPVLENVQVLAVTPNTFWQPGGSENIRIPGTARTVWVCRFATTDGGEGRRYEVWVDTETGAVIGGSSWVRRGGPRKPAPQARAKTRFKPAK